MTAKLQATRRRLGDLVKFQTLGICRQRPTCRRGGIRRQSNLGTETPRPFGSAARVNALTRTISTSYMSRHKHTNFIRRRSIILLSFLCVSTVCSCANQEPIVRKDSSYMHDSDDQYEEMVKQITNLPSWRSDQDFSVSDRRSYIYAASALSSKSFEDQKRILDQAFELVKLQEYNGFSEPESKFPLLFRVMFNLPEKMRSSSFVPYKGWSNWEEAFSSDGEHVNPSWPIAWVKDSMDFRLLALYAGSSGRYDPLSEFEYMKSNFPVRNLPVHRPFPPRPESP